MMLDWNAYLEQVSACVKEVSQFAPSAAAGYIAVTTRCDGCIVVHTDRAIKAGATREEVAEALGVAIALNAGAALTYSARVLDAYAAIDGAAKSAE